jgi:uncharacterized protein (TIGR02466 family)
MNNKFEVFQIFPTPVYRTSLDREFLNVEKKIFFDEKNFLKPNIGNKTSDNSYILNNKKLKKLKKFLDLHIKNYFKDIMKIEKVKPYITQSWLNSTKISQFHHSHTHPNSIISGVFYINANEQFDSIVFSKNLHNSFSFDVTSFTALNSDTWSFMIKTYDLILFPSTLNHRVEIKNEDNNRISLAFNVFAKGLFGNKSNLTELILK